MLLPPSLQKGDRIRIVSPSGKIAEEKVLPAKRLLEQEGYEVLIGQHIFSKHHQFAGTDQERLNDLQEAIDDSKCKVIICSRGGYGAIRIAPKIDFKQLHSHPKWLVGFSDITVLHAFLQKEQIKSIHGPMPGFFLKENQPTLSYNNLFDLLKGNYKNLTCPYSPYNRTGESHGELTGGNLSILYSLLGTPWEPETDGKILFLEDVSEYLYHIDRMINTLKLSGKLNRLKGLVLGGFTALKDNDNCPFGQSVEEIIIQATKEFNYPVCFQFPSGHIEENMPLILGARYRLTVNSEITQLGIM